ncbi:hypothetical protein H0X90_31225 [Burkholderia sp. 9775_39]|uniref:hypothetical protein n=1 Tax=unclassified Burkholderia TaxID=2613784 RepID=UPI0018C37720|nr:MULTISPECIES: hypothetical protein [unclassified Burkholderia]MBG0881281.1 hypothetical protein [Burkholderia sp. 9775_39]MBG0887642.1 hypothetical protein [Burkholderia sp. 9773_38]
MFNDYYLCLENTRNTRPTPQGNAGNMMFCSKEKLFRVKFYAPDIPLITFNQAYLNGKSLSYDVAFMKFDKNEVTGKTLEETVGSYGIVFNKTENSIKTVSVGGYPIEWLGLAVCERTKIYKNLFYNLANRVMDVFKLYADKCERQTGPVEPVKKGA